MPSTMALPMIRCRWSVAAVGPPRTSAAASAAAFAVHASLLLAAAPLGDRGLWLAFTLFLVARAAGQAVRCRGCGARPSADRG